MCVFQVNIHFRLCICCFLICTQRYTNTYKNQLCSCNSQVVGELGSHLSPFHIRQYPCKFYHPLLQTQICRNKCMNPMCYDMKRGQNIHECLCCIRPCLYNLWETIQSQFCIYKNMIQLCFCTQCMFCYNCLHPLNIHPHLHIPMSFRFSYILLNRYICRSQWCSRKIHDDHKSLYHPHIPFCLYILLQNPRIRYYMYKRRIPACLCTWH